MDEVLSLLKENSDRLYRDFALRIIPDLNPKQILGVRYPLLKRKAHEIIKEKKESDFIRKAPHFYFEEKMIHRFILQEIKSFPLLIKELDKFLPYVDCWAISDGFSNPIIKEHKAEFFVCVQRWLKSSRLYTKRFAIFMLMTYFLDEDFDVSHVEMVIKSDEENCYYLSMMVAFYLATALAKRFESVYPLLKKTHLYPFTFRQTVSKALSSRRISDGHKQLIRNLRA